MTNSNTTHSCGCDHDHEEKLAKHEHDHEGCCGHDHEHHHHHHDGCCDHDHEHDHHHHHHDGCCGHDHDHEEINWDEQGCGCGCGGHDEASFHIPQTIADPEKVAQAQAKLAQADYDIVSNDVANFLIDFKKLHDKLYTENSFYAIIGMTYGCVVTDYDEIDFLIKSYFESPNSKVNPEYLEKVFFLYTYIQANYLREDIFLNDFFALFDKSTDYIGKFKAYTEFLDTFVFAVSFAVENKDGYDQETKRHVIFSLQALNMLAREFNELETQFLPVVKKLEDPSLCEDEKDKELVELLNLESGRKYAEYDLSDNLDISVLIARDAILASSGLFGKLDEKEKEGFTRYDLHRALPRLG